MPFLDLVIFASSTEDENVSSRSLILGKLELVQIQMMSNMDGSGSAFDIEIVLETLGQNTLALEAGAIIAPLSLCLAMSMLKIHTSKNGKQRTIKNKLVEQFALICPSGRVAMKSTRATLKRRDLYFKIHAGCQKKIWLNS